MKRFLAVLFVGIIVAIFADNLTFAASAPAPKPVQASKPAPAQKIIKVCTLPYAPFVITDQDEQPINGFDIDLAKAMCQKMGTICKFIAEPTRAELLYDLNTKECDVWASGFTITAERKKDMDFTNPYYPATVSYAALKNTVFTSSPRDFKGKKIAVESGSHFVPYLKSLYSDDIIVVKFINYSEALAALKNKKVDAILSDVSLINYWLMDEANEKLLRLIEVQPDDQGLAIGAGYGMPVKKGNTELLDALNQALAQIKADGTYQTIVKRYFK